MAEIENTLFPVDDVPEVTEDEQEYDVEYRRSVQWDMETGDFVRSGANKLIVCDGHEAFRTWCYKVALTERFSCLAYPDELGVELEEALEEEEEEAVKLMVERTITEAIMVNPRTEYVGDFSFVWFADELLCTFSVKGVDLKEEFTITI